MSGAPSSRCTSTPVLPRTLSTVTGPSGVSATATRSNSEVVRCSPSRYRPCHGPSLGTTSVSRKGRSHRVRTDCAAARTSRVSFLIWTGMLRIRPPVRSSVHPSRTPRSIAGLPVRLPVVPAGSRAFQPACSGRAARVQSPSADRVPRIAPSASRNIRAAPAASAAGRPVASSSSSRAGPSAASWRRASSGHRLVAETTFPPGPGRLPAHRRVSRFTARTDVAVGCTKSPGSHKAP